MENLFANSFRIGIGFMLGVTTTLFLFMAGDVKSLLLMYGEIITRKLLGID